MSPPPACECARERYNLAQPAEHERQISRLSGDSVVDGATQGGARRVRPSSPGRIARCLAGARLEPRRPPHFLEEFQQIHVCTQNTLYELIVINQGGDVRVRGGRYFPEWTVARLAGAPPAEASSSVSRSISACRWSSMRSASNRDVAGAYRLLCCRDLRRSDLRSEDIQE